MKSLPSHIACVYSLVSTKKAAIHKIDQVNGGERVSGGWAVNKPYSHFSYLIIVQNGKMDTHIHKNMHARCNLHTYTHILFIPCSINKFLPIIIVVLKIMHCKLVVNDKCICIILQNFWLKIGPSLS